MAAFIRTRGEGETLRLKRRTFLEMIKIDQTEYYASHRLQRSRAMR